MEYNINYLLILNLYMIFWKMILFNLFLFFFLRVIFTQLQIIQETEKERRLRLNLEHWIRKMAVIKSLQITGYRFNHEKLHLLLNNKEYLTFLPCITCNINHFYTPLKSFLDSFRIQTLSNRRKKLPIIINYLLFCNEDNEYIKLWNLSRIIHLSNNYSYC